MKLLVTSVATRYYSKHTSTFNHCKFKNFMCRGRVAQWIRCPTSNQKIVDSIPRMVVFFCFEENTICKQLLFRARGIGCIKNGYYIFGQVSVATINWFKYEMRPEGDCR